MLTSPALAATSFRSVVTGGFRTINLPDATRLSQSTGRRPNEPSNLQNEQFVPMLLCLSDRLHLTKIIKDRHEQTDVCIFRNLQRTYYEALNPIHRWTPSVIVQFHRWLSQSFGLWAVFSNPFVRFEKLVWVRLLCSLFRMFSFWDLREIKEAQVC